MTSAPYRIGVISDTHGRLDPMVFDLFSGVNLILHAGDVGDDNLLVELEAIAPVQAVSGNVDGPPHPRRRPLERRLETPAGRIAMTHGHLTAAPSTDLARMANYFAEFKPDIIVYGHSHIARLDFSGHTRIFNPGSAGAPRFGRPPSVGMITAPQTGSVNIEILGLGARPATID